jgi:tetratricopeptide (TPR) repeat protein
LDRAKRLIPEPEAGESFRPVVLLNAGREDEALEIIERNPERAFDLIELRLNILAGRDLSRGDPKAALSRIEAETSCSTAPIPPFYGGDCPVHLYMRVLQANEETQLVANVDKELKSALGSSEAANKILESILLIGNYSKAFYLSRYYSVRGDRDHALRVLEKAVELGYRGWAFPLNDWRFFAYHDIRVDAIRGDPRFRAAVSIIEADMAQQLENVREMQRRGEVPTLEEVRALIASHEENG